MIFQKLIFPSQSLFLYVIFHILNISYLQFLDEHFLLIYLSLNTLNRVNFIAFYDFEKSDENFFQCSKKTSV